MTLRDLHWPSNKQHSFVEGGCTDCGAVCQKCGGLVTVPSEVMRLLRERDKSKAAEVA